MKDVICYARKSRVSETDELDRQVRLVQDYCKSKNYTIKQIFSEVGSSVDADRPEYTALLNLLSSTKGCTIVVTDLDRLSRDTVILGLFQQLCKEQQHKVELTNGTVYDYSDYTDAFTSDIIASVSAYIYRQTSAKMYRGLRQAMKEGKRVGSKLYGYDIVNKRLVINPIQADIVKRVFNMIAEGEGTQRVAEILKEEGVKNNNNNFFSSRAVRNIITNEGYTGQKGDSLYPPLVTKELFLKANSNLKEIQKSKRQLYPLSGKIVCSHCNTILIIGNKKDRGHALVYNCKTSNIGRSKSSNEDSLSCNCKGCNLDIINNLVVSDCKAFIECKLQKLYSKLTEDKKILSAHLGELQELQREIAENKEKLNRLNTLFVLGNITEDILREQSESFKDVINLKQLELERIENYSLMNIIDNLQSKVVKLEELQGSNSIDDLVKLVDHVEYYKDNASIQVNTIFRENV